MNRDWLNALKTVAVTLVQRGRLPDVDEVPGTQALDVWKDGPHGAVLFWLDEDVDPHGRGEPLLCDVYVQQGDGGWQAMSAGSASTGPIDQALAGLQPGLHRIGGGSAGRVFVTWAIATPEVALIRLCDEAGGIRERRPGRHGYVLLGVTSNDPLTRAYAVDHSGETFPGDPLTLWAPPRD